MEQNSISAKRKAYIVLMRSFIAVSVALTCGLTLFLIGYVLISGLPHVTWSFFDHNAQYSEWSHWNFA